MKKIVFIGCLCFLMQSCGKKPVADFSWSPQNPHAGEEIQFTNTSLDAKKYSWNLGDMTISDEKNPRHVYQNAGEYIIDLNAYNGLSSDVKTVTITILP